MTFCRALSKLGSLIKSNLPMLNSTISRNSLFGLLLVLADMCAVIGCAWIGFDLYPGAGAPFTAIHALFVLALSLFTFNLFNLMSVYSSTLISSFTSLLSRLTLAWFCVSLLTLSLTYLTKTGEELSRGWVFSTLISAYLAMILIRVATLLLIHGLRRRGYNQKNIVIVGLSSLGVQACERLKKHKENGLEPVALFDDNHELHGKLISGVEVVGGIDGLTHYIEHKRLEGEQVHQVWLALPLSEASKIESIQQSLLDTATSVYLVPDLLGFKLASLQINYVEDLPVMRMSVPALRGYKRAIKRISDFLLSTLALTLLSPLFLVVAVWIKLDSKGPVFFKQRRYGKLGQEILVWKFRSMTVTEDSDVVVQATRGDQRVTKSGAVLRKTSIDELPQLINVFIGNMSLVGPRPHAVAHNEFYRTKVPGYMARHQIKPGITGLAQVNGCRGETSDIKDMERRVQFDLQYIKNWSVWLDVWIMIRTVFTVINTKDTY